ncbi:CIA30 family protein [Patescibacteria group bacterium]|nr:CIA30 family protein [Patescibacteria group bacterium]
MTIFNCKNRITIKGITVVLVFLTGFTLYEYSYAALEKDDRSLDFDSGHWKVLNDSGWPGASIGYVETSNEKKDSVRFNYTLKATELWLWPEIDFFIEFERVNDLTGYTGVQLYIKGEKREEVYFYFLTKDKNTGIPKPCWYRFIVTDKYKKIYLPFSQFKIAKDWTPRHRGFNPSIEWDKVKTFGLHKKGRDGERGSIYLLNINFLQKELPEIPNLERVRSLPPKHSLINLINRSSEKTDAKIRVYSCAFRQKDKMISPCLYGANWGVWLDLPDKKKVAPLGLKLIRAGGPFMDRYNWRSSKYTFPANEKALTMTDLDEFIQYCRQIGAEPLIQINALGYAPDEKNKDKFTKCMDPEDTADLVRYLNKERGYNIKFFEIGNEPFIWHDVHFDVRKTPCSIREYFEIFKKISVAMKKAQAEINPALQIKIFAPAISSSWMNWGTLSPEDSQRQIIEYFLNKCYEYQNNKTENPEGFRILDVLSFHLYPIFRDPLTGKIEKDISLILRSTQTWWSHNYINNYDHSLPCGQIGEVLPKFKKWIETNYPGTELAITEFNIESQSMVDYDPIIKVLYLADLYGIMAKYRVGYATQFCLNSSDHNIALIDETDNITPLYYVLALYSLNFKGSILDAGSSLPGRLNVYACNNGDNIIVMVVNKEKKSFYTEVILEEGPEGEDAISFSHNFPALSLTCIKILANKSNNLAEYWEYGEQQINGIIDNNPSL